MTISDKLKEIRVKLSEAFNKVTTDEEKKLLKEAEVKLEGELTPAPAPVVPVALKEAKTKDGKLLSYEGELKEGVKISIVDPATGPSDAPDGTHELEDGTKITTVGGLVTKVESVAPVMPEAAPQLAAPQLAQVVQQMSAQFSAQEKEFEVKLQALVSENKSLKEIQLSTLKAVNAMQDVLKNFPIDTISLETKQKSYEELTPAERYALDHPIN